MISAPIIAEDSCKAKLKFSAFRRLVSANSEIFNTRSQVTCNAVSIEALTAKFTFANDARLVSFLRLDYLLKPYKNKCEKKILG